MPDQPRPMIYLDADACPVKEQVYRVVARYAMPLRVVSNGPLRVPRENGGDVQLVLVEDGPDVADDWIAERAGDGDLVLTADILLAARVLENGARCLDFRGGAFKPGSIGDVMASREINAFLRSMGEITRGPAPFSQKDRSNFASALDAAVSKMARDRDRQATNR